MLKLIYGPKGTGKTKQIIDQTNEAAEKAKGNVIFISKSKTYSVNINFDVKCIYTDEYDIDSMDSFRGFLNGIAAANYDTEYVFVDGVARITRTDLADLEPLFEAASKLSNIAFVFTISASKEELPEYIFQYLN